MSRFRSLSIILSLVALLTLGTAPRGLAQSAQTQLQVTLTAFNITQNRDGTAAANKAGDVIRYTATVKNLGPGDLRDYIMRVNIREVLKYSTILDLGGGVIEGDFIVFPPILQAADCNCENSNTFRVKLNNNICPVTRIPASYEDVTVSLPIDCPAPPPTQPRVPATPPKTTTSGPGEMALIGAGGIALLSGGFVLLRRKKKS